MQTSKTKTSDDQAFVLGVAYCAIAVVLVLVVLSNHLRWRDIVVLLVAVVIWNLGKAIAKPEEGTTNGN